MAHLLPSRGLLAAVVLSAALVVTPGFAAGAAAQPGDTPSAVASASACTKAKRAVKKARKAVKKAQKAVTRARRSRSAARLSNAKSKLKKAKKKLKKAKKRQRSACGGGGGGTRDGRYSGTYAENNIDLFFNVVGSRLFTGPLDDFYIDASCHNTDPGYGGPQDYTDPLPVSPVEARIAGNGDFSGSGTFTPGFGLSIPWKLTGHISGGNITGGALSVSYTDTYGNPCSGTTHFTASWWGAYTF